MLGLAAFFDAFLFCRLRYRRQVAAKARVSMHKARRLRRKSAVPA